MKALIFALILASPFAAAEEHDARGTFLKSCGLKSGAIYFDRELTLYGHERARLLFASGKTAQYLAALDEAGGFVYVEMPWHARGDVRDARIVDLAGDGRQALVVRYRAGANEALGIWRVPAESHIRRVFTAPVDRAGGARLVRRGRANDLVIGSGAAAVRYQFVGDAIQRLR
jgi:hypothetical protein